MKVSPILFCGDYAEGGEPVILCEADKLGVA